MSGGRQSRSFPQPVQPNHGLPIVAVVGRPNVGKSTFFNRMIGNRRALSFNRAGVTRDRHYAEVEYLGRPFVLIDTGGFEPDAEADDVFRQVKNQALVAVEEADVVLVFFDVRQGVMPGDQDVVDLLRAYQKPTLYVVNKVDTPALEAEAYDFYRLGMDELFPISVERTRGADALLDSLIELLPKTATTSAQTQNDAVQPLDEIDEFIHSGDDFSAAPAETADSEDSDDDSDDEELDGEDFEGEDFDGDDSEDEDFEDGLEDGDFDGEEFDGEDSEDGDESTDEDSDDLGDEGEEEDDDATLDRSPKTAPAVQEKGRAGRTGSSHSGPQVFYVGAQDGSDDVDPDEWDGEGEEEDDSLVDDGSGLELELQREVAKLAPMRNIQPPTVPRIALVGRPNVGKSSLANRILGFERQVIHPVAGTTRDSIDIPFEKNGRPYVLVDTAGVRRKSRISDQLEAYTVLKSFRAVETCDIALLLINAEEGVTSQEKRLAGLIEEKGKGVAIIVNKWDLVKGVDRHTFADKVLRGLEHIRYSPVHFISAKTGMGIHGILPLTDRISSELGREVGTTQFNRFLKRVVEAHQPPIYMNHSPRLYYGVQVRNRPPTFLLFSNKPEGIRPDYRRYLENRIREEFGFVGAPVHLVVRARKR